MNFIEQTRTITEAGDTHIHSVAYHAIEDFNVASNLLEIEMEALAQAQNKVVVARERIKAAKNALLDALATHYGELPPAIDVFGKLLIITDDDEPQITIIKPKQVTDLYRIERKAEAA